MGGMMIHPTPIPGLCEIRHTAIGDAILARVRPEALDTIRALDAR